MSALRKIVSLSLFAALWLSAPSLSAQSQVTKAQNLTDSQKRGEAIFLQKCPLCHTFSSQKKSLGIQAQSDLEGLFSKPTTSEAAVRQIITAGLPKLMPAFQYSLTPEDLNHLVAYLKIR